MPHPAPLLTAASGLLAVRSVTPCRPVDSPMGRHGDRPQPRGTAGGTAGRRLVASRSTGWVDCVSAAQRAQIRPGWVSAAQVSHGTRVSSLGSPEGLGRQTLSPARDVAAADGTGVTSRQRSVIWAGPADHRGRRRTTVVATGRDEGAQAQGWPEQRWAELTGTSRGRWPPRVAAPAALREARRAPATRRHPIDPPCSPDRRGDGPVRRPAVPAAGRATGPAPPPA
jgi:hypothetical protein